MYILTPKCARATKACTFFNISKSQLPKLLLSRQLFTLFTSKCASRHNGMQLFDISTSKSAPSTEHIRARCVLYVLTSTCASRHDGVHFFDISTFKNAPRLKCFAHFDFEIRARHKGVHPMQVLRLRQALGEQVNQVRGAPELFGCIFFNISTSKIAPNRSVFNTFDFEMCFAPQ